MSLHSLFSTARQSLLASQAATQATSNNVANVETPGYSRRTVGLRSPGPVGRGVVFHSTPTAGSGVAVESFDRARSGILDAAVRRGRAGAGGAGEGAAVLSGLEAQLAADGGDAFLGAVGGFFDAWSGVASSPADGGSRDALLAAGAHLASTLRSADDRLQRYGDAVRADLGATVDRANALLAEVAALNEAVQRSTSQGVPDPDALDRRDLLLDELAGLAPVAIRPQANGSVTVSIDGMVAVQDGEARPVRLGTDAAGALGLFADGGARPLRLDAIEGGALGAQLDVLASAIPGARQSLDAIAGDLVSRVNAAHGAGTGLDGATGRDFFDPAGTTAASIAVAITDPDAIAAGTSGQGDGSVALDIAALGESVHGGAVELLAGIGARVRTAAAAARGNAAVTAQAEALRDGVSRVSLDEEMTHLIRYQQAYAASARVLQTAESLFDTLLTL